MSHGLDRWLFEATQNLSQASSLQVKDEIQQHYESAFEIAEGAGASPEEADRQALADLGSSRTANRLYCKVLLTSQESRILQRESWEWNAIHSRPLLCAILRCVPVIALFAALASYYLGLGALGQIFLTLSIGSGLLMIPPMLAVYTPSRSRIVRFFKNAFGIAAPVLLFGPSKFNFGLLFCCLWSVLWIEWTRNSIRRKLPIDQWPHHLYL